MNSTDSGSFDVPRTMSFLGYLADRFSKRIAHFVCEELRGKQREGDLVDQWSSTLSPRNHCAAVRRRLDNHEGGADVDGRRYLLTPQALREEHQRRTDRHLSARRTSDDDDPVADLDRTLAGLRGER